MTEHRPMMMMNIIKPRRMIFAVNGPKELRARYKNCVKNASGERFLINSTLLFIRSN